MTTQSDRCVTLYSGNTACLRMTLRWWLADSFLKNTSLVNSLSTPCVSERWSAWASLNSCLHGVSASCYDAVKPRWYVSLFCFFKVPLPPSPPHRWDGAQVHLLRVVHGWCGSSAHRCLGHLSVGEGHVVELVQSCKRGVGGGTGGRRREATGAEKQFPSGSGVPPSRFRRVAERARKRAQQKKFFSPFSFF